MIFETRGILTRDLLSISMRRAPFTRRMNRIKQFILIDLQQ